MTVLTTPVTAPAPAGDPLDPRSPWVRLAGLFDDEGIRLLHEPDDSGVQAAAGKVGGRPVYAYCSDARRMGGALGSAGSDHIVDAIALAQRDGVPVVGIWHSGGARLAEGVESMDGVGRVFAAMTRASGRIAQISVVLGPAAGAAAYGPALTDIVIMSEDGRMFVTGPSVVEAVTGERVSMADLGGSGAHGARSGVAHVLTATDAEALGTARTLVGLFADPGHFDLSATRPQPGARDLLPASARRAYDMRPVLRALLDPAVDGAGFVELQPKWAPNVIVGLGRLAGRAVGVIANNPLRKGGCLDALSAEKAARFVQMCDALGVPLVVLVDVPGYLPGVGQEWSGVIRRGAKLLHAFARATVPRVTLILRKSYGGAYIAMNSRSLGATAVYAWPEAEIAVMGAEAAVGVLHARKLAAAGSPQEREALLAMLVEEHERVSGGVRRALALGVVDEVIDPADTRYRLAGALARAPLGRGGYTNIPL
jgi:acetyl-CoA/propionyl-CoA carboxylase carboxyl transferase subunit